MAFGKIKLKCKDPKCETQIGNEATINDDVVYILSFCRDCLQTIRWSRNYR